MTLTYYLRRGYAIWSRDGILSLLTTGYAFVDWRVQKIRWTNGVYLNSRSYTDSDISKHVYVNPNIVDSRQKPLALKYELMDPGVVYGGRWDRVVSPFLELYTAKSLKRRFDGGAKWHETEYYHTALTNVEKGEWRGCSSEGDLKRYFERIDALYERIEREGYKSQQTLLEREPEETRARNNDAPSPELNEVGVHIDRNGEFIWGHRGQHRLCIAQILGIDEIPVQVLARHEKWQAIRDEVRSAEDIELLSHQARQQIDHPDLKDVTPDDWL